MSHAYSPCSPGFQSSSKRKLSRSMLNDLESLFQADLSKLTIHVDTLPLQYGAAALAGDNSICLAPQYGDFSAASTKAILAHELAHLFQQQTMDVPERAGALLIDPYLELHANTWACLALLDEQSRRHFPHRSDGLRPLGQGAANVMQPWILMAKGITPVCTVTRAITHPCATASTFSALPMSDGVSLMMKNLNSSLARSRHCSR